MKWWQVKKTIVSGKSYIEKRLGVNFSRELGSSDSQRLHMEPWFLVLGSQWWGPVLLTGGVGSAIPSLLPFLLFCTSSLSFFLPCIPSNCPSLYPTLFLVSVILFSYQPPFFPCLLSFATFVHTFCSFGQLFFPLSFILILCSSFFFPPSLLPSIYP